MKPSPELLAMLRALELEFAAKLPDRLQEMLDVLPHCAAPQHLATLHRMLHSLAGSAGSFGQEQLGVEVRALETQVARSEAQGNWCEQDALQISAALRAMRERLLAAQHHPPQGAPAES